MIPAGDINRALNEIIRREGGYVDHPDDRGGPTKYGITMRTLAEWRGKPQTDHDVGELTENEARQIYEARYIQPFAKLWPAIADAFQLIVDCAVHHGITRTTILMQRALGVRDDGRLGPETIAAIEDRKSDLHRLLLAQRLRFIGEIITRNPSQAVFAAGWLNRLSEFV